MSTKRQKNQLVLAFTEEGRSEAPKASREGTEALTAKCDTERPARNLLNRRTRTRIYGGVAGVSGRPLPLCRSRSIRAWHSHGSEWCGAPERRFPLSLLHPHRQNVLPFDLHLNPQRRP